MYKHLAPLEVQKGLLPAHRSNGLLTASHHYVGVPDIFVQFRWHWTLICGQLKETLYLLPDIKRARNEQVK